MAELIKWWKSKTFWIIFGLFMVDMIATFLLLYFVASPWWWIGMIIVTVAISIIVRKIISKKIEEITKDKISKTSE